MNITNIKQCLATAVLPGTSPVIILEDWLKWKYRKLSREVRRRYLK